MREIKCKGILIVGDPHGASRTPARRLDNYRATFLAKLRQVHWLPFRCFGIDNSGEVVVEPTDDPVQLRRQEFWRTANRGWCPRHQECCSFRRHTRRMCRWWPPTR